MAGLVIKDLMGGDFAVHLVNDDMWQQILAVKSELSATGRYDDAGFAKVVAWLMDEGEPAAPELGCPAQREGFIVQTWYCQAPIIEPARIVDNIDGIVFLPAY